MELRPCRRDIFSRPYYDLALAIVTESAGFQNRRQADGRDGRRQIREGIHRREGRRGDTQSLKKQLLNVAILSNLKCLRRRIERLMRGEDLGRGNRNFLKFVGNVIVSAS